MKSQRKFEIIAVIITGLLKFIFMGLLEWQGIYITSAMLFWGLYIFWRTNNNETLFAYWGFTKNNLSESFKATGLFAAVAIGIMAIYGHAQNTLGNSFSILPLLLIYPLWGLVQQFMVMSLVAGNLRDMEDEHYKNRYIILGTAFLFGMVHLPNIWLTIGTTGLAVVYGLFFLKWRNLWALGLFHGWIGAFFYIWVLDHNPWLDVFG